MTSPRPLRQRALPFTRAALALVVLACQGQRVEEVEVGTVKVTPTDVTLLPGDSVRLSAEVRDGAGGLLPSSVVAWSVSPSGVASVRGDGLVTALAPGDATVNASARGVSASASVRVQSPGVLAVEPGSLTLFGLVGADAQSGVLHVFNGAGDASLPGLSVSVGYPEGTPVGWLTPSLRSDTTPADVTVRPSTATLGAGTYRATLKVAAPSVEPVEIPVELQMVVDRPLIAVSASALGFVARAGGSPPPEQTLRITNTGSGALEGLSLDVAYETGSGWLSAKLDSTSAPTELVLAIVPGGLAPGTYRARVSILSREAANSPVSIAVNLALDPPPAADLSVQKTGPAAAGSGETVPWVITVSNLGPGAADDVVLMDSLPLGMTVRESSGATVSGSVLQWGLGSIPAGATVTRTLGASASSVGKYQNIARATSSTPDPAGTNNRDTITVQVTAPADLSVAKTGPASASIGDTLRYLLTVHNGGPYAAAAVTLVDSLPDGLTALGASRGASVGGRVVSWSLGDMEPGASRTDTVRARVERSGAYVNVAAVSSPTQDPDEGDRRATVTTAVGRVADLSVTKSAPDSVTRGDTVEYVVTFSNTGPDTAAAVLVRDSLPPGVVFVSATGGGTVAGRVVTWNAGALANGGTRTERVRAVLPDTGRVVNVVRASTTTADPDSADLRATATVLVVPFRADLSVEKAGPSTAFVGDTLTYAITLRNYGPEAAASVTLSDSLPAGATFLSATGSGTASGRRVGWSLGDLAVGARKTFQVKVRADASGTLTDVARVASATLDPDTSDRRTTLATSVQARADLSVRKSGPAAAQVNETVTYTLTAVNDGPSPAAAVTLVDSLPAGLTFVSASDGGTASGGVVTWSLGDVASGSSVPRTVTVRAATAGAQVDVARVTSVTADPDTSDQRATFTTTVAEPPPMADLSVEKSGPATATVGESVTYTLTAANGGPSPAAAVTLVDSLPAGLTFVSASDGGTASGGVVTWSLGDVASGSSVPRTVTVRAATAGAQVNVARVTSATADPDTSDQRATFTTTVAEPAPMADLSVEKSGPATATVGESVTYTLTAANGGPDAAAAVTLVDSLPAGLTFVSASDGGTASGGVVTWSLGDVASGSSVPRTVTVRAATAGAQVNVARVTSATTDPDTSDQRATFTTTVAEPPPMADLSVEKSGPATATVGESVTYTLTAANGGPSPAAAVTLVDSLPAGLTFVSASDGGTASGGVVTWSLGDVASGSSVPRTVTVRAATAGAQVNVARVTSATTDPDTSDQRATFTTTVAEPPPMADLSVEKSGPATATVGESVTYTLTAANGGPSPAAAVTLVDSLPAGLTFVSASDGGTASGGVVTWSLGDVASGSSVPRTVTVRAATAGAQVNVARVTSATADPDTSDQRATFTTTVAEPPPMADLSVEKSGPATATVGESVTYTLTAANGGPDAAAAVTLVDSLPAGLTFVSASDGGTASGGVVTWSLGDVASGSSVPRTVTVRAATAGAQVNVARVTSATTDPDTSDQRATFTTTVAEPPPMADLSVEKSGPATATVGESVTYTLTAANGGPDAAAAVTLVDSLPAGLTFVSASDGGTASGGVVTWSLGDVASGSSVPRTVTVRAATAGAQVDVARVTSATADPDTSDQRATFTTTVAEPPPMADLSVEKSGPATATVGESVTYTLTAANGGPDAAAAVTLVDSLPAGLTFVSASDGGTASGGVVTWSLGDVASGSSVPRTVTVRAATAGAQVNVARVTSATTDPDTSDQRATFTTTVAEPPPMADLSVEKSGPATATVGESVTYTLTAANGGPDAAAAVTLVDSLPAGLTFVSASDGGTASGGVVTWSLGDVASGSSVPRTVTVRAATAGAQVDVARVTSVTADPDTSDQRATFTTTVAEPPPMADLSVEKSGPATATVGESVTYTLTAANGGPDAAAAVTLVDSLPAGLTFVSASDGGTASGGVVTWSLGDVASGSSVPRTVTVRAATAGAQVDVARVTSVTADPDTSDQRATFTTTVAEPPPMADLSVEKSGPATATVGESVTYTLTAANGGPDAAAAVTLVDSLPAGLTFVSASDGGTASGGVVTWSLGDVASGSSVPRTVTVRAATAGAQVDVARVTSVTADPDTSDQRATFTTTVAEPPPMADLSVEKSGPPKKKEGDTFDYDLHVNNDGPDPARGIVLVDSLPPGLTFVEATEGGTASGGVVTWFLGDLDKGGKRTAKVTVRATGSGTVSNVARVHSDTGDPDPTNDRDTRETDIAASMADQRATLTTTVTKPPPTGPPAPTQPKVPS